MSTFEPDLWINHIENEGITVFDLNSLPVAILNEEYTAVITASIKREPNDSWYNYAFRLQGGLPRGISFITELGSRSIQIAGTPTELGSYGIKLEVIVTEPESYLNYEQSVEQYDDGDDLCRNTRDKNYVLEVKAQQQ